MVHIYYRVQRRDVLHRYDVATRPSLGAASLWARLEIHGQARRQKVVYLEEYDDFDQARWRERQLKDWSQAKKLKLIRGEWSKW